MEPGQVSAGPAVEVKNRLPFLILLVKIIPPTPAFILPEGKIAVGAVLRLQVFYLLPLPVLYRGEEFAAPIIIGIGVNEHQDAVHP